MSGLSTDASLVDDAVEAVRAGRPVVLATDTVYGLCADPSRPEAVLRLQQLKGRDEGQPIALLAFDVDTLTELVPELPAALLRALLPGPLTLVLPNPARRFAELAGALPESLGVRVPELSGAAREIVQRIGAVAATSANLHGGPDPTRLEDVPAAISEAALLVDGGEVPGVPSTVVDLTGAEPRIVREGAASAAEVLRRLAALTR